MIWPNKVYTITKRWFGVKKIKINEGRTHHYKGLDIWRWYAAREINDQKRSYTRGSEPKKNFLKKKKKEREAWKKNKSKKRVKNINK